jgi:hypothetical protein
MLKSVLLHAIQQEIRRHDLSHFQDEKDEIVHPGCPTCRKKFYTVSHFIDHLSDDVLPSLLDRLSSEQVRGREHFEPQRLR